MNEELKVIISAEISDLKNKVNEAKESISSFAKNSKVSMEDFQKGLSKAGEYSNKFLKTTATATAAAGAAFLALGPATAEYREEQAKLATAFEAAGSSADVAKTVYNDLFRVMGESDTSVEAANHLAKLTTNQKDLSEWTKICQGVYATFGDSLPIEGLTEAANETARTGSLTGSLADALNWAGVSEDEFKEQLEACNSTAEREQLIRSTLIDLYDDAADKYEENAAATLAQNEAQAKLSESMAALGEAAQPVVTLLTTLAADVLSELSPYIQEFVSNSLPKLSEILVEVAKAIGEVIGWIADHWELVSTIGTIVLAIAAAISVMSAAQTAYNTVMGITAVVSAPVIGTIALIVAGIAALVAIIVVCVKHWDDIKNAAKKAVEGIKNFVSDCVAKVKEWFNNMKEAIVNVWNKVKEKASEVWTNIKEGIKEKVENIKENASEKFEKVKEKITESMEEAKENTKERLSKMKQAFDEHGGGIKGAAAAIMTDVKTRFQQGYDKVNELTGGKLDKVVQTMKSKLDKTKETVSNIMGKVKDAFGNAMDGAKDLVGKGIEKIKSFFNFKWELPKIKLPHFKIEGKFSLNPPSIPKFSIDWYAQGGVFDKPTLFPYGGRIGGLGEAGAEAIVPLEKNTQWLDKIAERLAGRASSTPIVLQVDGKTFAQTSISSINQLTRQTGSLALNLV